MKVEDTGEFGLIEELKKLLPSGENVIEGAGDDAAVLSGGRKGKYLLLTTDALVEKVHFRRSAGAKRIGRKALAVNLSDIAAMGGIPLWAVVNLGLPAGISVRYCRQMYRGIAELAEEFRLSIVGGDTFRSKEGIILAVAVVGEVASKKCIFRKGAKPGDVLCLTGELGEAARGKHLDFIPRIKEGRYLAQNFSPSAMIDISDGLFADLIKLCRSSGVGAVIGEDAIPVSLPVRKKKGKRFYRAVSGGEEFELLFALPEEEIAELLSTFPRATGTRVTPIGKTLADPERLELIDHRGLSRPLPDIGYDHFKMSCNHSGSRVHGSGVHGSGVHGLGVHGSRLHIAQRIQRCLQADQTKP